MALDLVAGTSPRVAARRGRIRRCRVRRVSILPSQAEPRVRVDCLLLGGDHPVALGSMEEARSICNACEAPSVWRADEA